MPEIRPAEERMLDSFRIMVPSIFKTRVKDMCADLGITLSDLTRDYWEVKLREYDAKRAKK